MLVLTTRTPKVERLVKIQSRPAAQSEAYPAFDRSLILTATISASGAKPTPATAPSEVTMPAT